MDDEIWGADTTLAPEALNALRALAQIRTEVITDVLARKRRVAATEADVDEIKGTLKILTDRVLRAIGERDLRDQELPA